MGMARSHWARFWRVSVTACARQQFLDTETPNVPPTTGGTRYRWWFRCWFLAADNNLTVTSILMVLPSCFLTSRHHQHSVDISDSGWPFTTLPIQPTLFNTDFVKSIYIRTRCFMISL